MKNFLLCIALVSIFTIGLTGCFCTNEPIELEFLTNEAGFPIGFTRISDGAQIGLGMSRDEVENILGEPKTSEELGEIRFLERFGIYDDSLSIFYNDNNIAEFITHRSEDWVATGGFFIGDDIQNVIDSDKFSSLIYSNESHSVIILDNLEAPKFELGFQYTTDGSIIGMTLVVSNTPLWFW